jgi:hypothetical protein
MGSGYRTFTAGEVLTASNVQNYLQDQAVMVFGGTAARSSAIGTANFEEGMLTYLTDVDKLQVYTGAAFADVYPAAASTQGLTLINTTSFSGVTSFSLPADTFTTTYTNYRIFLSNLSNSTGSTTYWRMRAAGSDATGTDYAGNWWYWLNTSGNGFYSTSTNAPQLFDNANFAVIDISQPKVAVPTKLVMMAESNAAFFMAQGYHGLSTSYDSLTFIRTSGTTTGTCSVYGYNI